EHVARARRRPAADHPPARLVDRGHAAMTGPLAVDGTAIVGADGPVLLRGFGLGGWMNMENFITGYPATESQMRRAMLRTMGRDAYDAFFDRLLDVFFTDEDAAYLASLGLNSLRVPFNHRHFEDDVRPFEIDPAG